MISGLGGGGGGALGRAAGAAVAGGSGTGTTRGTGGRSKGRVLGATAAEGVIAAGADPASGSALGSTAGTLGICVDTGAALVTTGAAKLLTPAPAFADGIVTPPFCAGRLSNTTANVHGPTTAITAATDAAHGGNVFFAVFLAVGFTIAASRTTGGAAFGASDEGNAALSISPTAAHGLASTTATATARGAGATATTAGSVTSLSSRISAITSTTPGASSAARRFAAATAGSAVRRIVLKSGMYLRISSSLSRAGISACLS